MLETKYKGREVLLHTAWAECATGPGWVNTIYWAVISKIGGPQHGVLRKVALQPDEQSSELQALFDISVATQKSVVAEVATLWNAKE